MSADCKRDLDLSKLDPDEALLELHRRLAARNAAKAGSFISLSEEQRRAYFRDARRRSRTRERAARDAGMIKASTANIRNALADAALMIVATGAPGAEQILAVLTSVFQARPGVVMSVVTKARQGRLRPKLAKAGG